MYAKTCDEVQEALKGNYIDHIDNMAQLDTFRHARTGIPEVIFAESKSTEMVLEITQRFLTKNHYASVRSLPGGRITFYNRFIRF